MSDDCQQIPQAILSDFSHERVRADTDLARRTSFMMEHGMRRPQPGLRLDLRVKARAENVSAVRRAIEALDLPTTLIEDAKLLVSELVTNSIRHAGLGPEDDIVIAVSWSGRVLRVIVWDRTIDATLSPVAGAFRPPPGAESGWGLF